MSSAADIVIGHARCRVTGTDLDQPLSVQLLSFSATATKRGVSLRWRTASEVDVLGYHVYRERAGKRMRVSRALIPAARRADGGAATSAYSWLDRVPRGNRWSRYWLQSVHIDGRRTWYGPIRVRV